LSFAGNYQNFKFEIKKMMNVQEWLDSEKRDYGIGLAILGKHCKNRILLQNMGRKRMPEKLEYELGKLVQAPPPALPEGEGDKNAETTAPALKGAKKKEQVEQTEHVEITEREAGNPDNLPPVLKAKWKQNQDYYKEIRSLHEKLKLMEKATPEDRQPLTERVSKLDDTIRANWKEIDAYVPGSEVAPVVGIDNKRMQANRKYISTNLKRLPTFTDTVKKAKVLEQLQLRYNEMKTAGEMFAPHTVDLLVNLGIIV